MYPGMMDPELIRLAQEQMNRMSPAELTRIQQQMMSNPELMRMASESMQNLRPEDLRHAAEQLKSTRPDEMAEIGEKMANATPEEIASMRSQVDAQVSYALNAAQMLKKQGNELHSQGKFKEALQKYLLAKKNVKGIPASKGRTILLACSLNLMSCYLKTKQYEECIKEGTEVLAYDANNVKALYRRGQAYKESGELEDAVSDLTKALEVSPDDDTIAEVLSGVKEKLTEQGGPRVHRGLIIEEITEEDRDPSSEKVESTSVKFSASEPQETNLRFKSQQDTTSGIPTTNSEYLQTLKDDPEAIRSFQNFLSHTDPETLTSLGAGKPEGISSDMMKTASNMISKMSPDELQRMLQMATSFQGENPLLRGESPGSSFNSVPPGLTPDMLKTATDMMNKMPAGELQKMFEMASSLNGKASASAAAASPSNGFRSESVSEARETRESFTANGGESSSSQGFLSSRSAPQESFPSSSSNLQEQMRNQMKDPAMREMMSSMMKNMSPEMMANMGEQFGFKLSREDAEKAQQAMSSLSPESLDKMMKWADRIQRGVEGAKKTKKLDIGKTRYDDGSMHAHFGCHSSLVWLHWALVEDPRDSDSSTI